MDAVRIRPGTGKRIAGGGCFSAGLLAAGGLLVAGSGLPAVVAFVVAVVGGLYARYQSERCRCEVG